MNLILVTISLIVLYSSTIECRPQSVQIEKQKVYHIDDDIGDMHLRKAHARGSVEETERILKEIEKINLSLGYRKRVPMTFPRISNEGYFYPRQDLRPQFLTKPKTNTEGRSGHEKSINPFNEQNFYYPAPYLQAPIKSLPGKFSSNKYYFPIFPINMVSDTSKDDDSIRLGTIVVLPRKKQKHADREGRSREIKGKNTEPQKGTVPISNNSEETNEEDDISVPSIIEEIAEYEVMGIPEALGIADTEDVEDDDEEEEKQEPSTTALPILPNDKFLNALKIQGNENESEDEDEEEEDEDEDEIPEEARKLVFPQLRAINISNAFNLTNQIEKFQNFTKKFTFKRNDENSKETATDKPADPVDYEEEVEEQQENVEDEKSPFGPFFTGPKEQAQLFKDGGLIIQRLRVRHGGIAIAGPGGVATAGSGGTAIVGPNGIAFTHPRGLAIGGPGSKIYAVPETTDLQKLAMKHTSRSLNIEDGVLVARGPAIFYNKP